MKGANLTSRADEAERRAQAALILLDTPGYQDLADYAAHAILVLPEGHKLRDVAKARAAVREQLASYQANTEPGWDSAALALAVASRGAVRHRRRADRVGELGRTIATHLEPSTGRRLWSAVEGFYLALVHEAKGPQWRERAAQAHARIDPSTLSDEDRTLNELQLMQAAVVDDNQLGAAERLKEALASGTLSPRIERRLALMEARVRLAADQWERVIILLETRLDGYEEDYVTAIHAEDRQTAGDAFGDACTRPWRLHTPAPANGSPRSRRWSAASAPASATSAPFAARPRPRSCWSSRATSTPWPAACRWTGRPRPRSA